MAMNLLSTKQGDVGTYLNPRPYEQYAMGLQGDLSSPGLRQYMGAQTGMNAYIQSALQNQLAQRNFLTQALPQYTSQEAAAGRALSGQSSLRANQMAQGVEEQAGANINDRANSLVSNMIQNQFLPSFGVRIQ